MRIVTNLGHAESLFDGGWQAYQLQKFERVGGRRHPVAHLVVKRHLSLSVVVKRLAKMNRHTFLAKRFTRCQVEVVSRCHLSWLVV